MRWRLYVEAKLQDGLWLFPEGEEEEEEKKEG